MGWGPLKLSQNSSYNKISEKTCDVTTYITLGPKYQGFPGLRIVCVQKNDYGQSLIFSIIIKQTLF